MIKKENVILGHRVIAQGGLGNQLFQFAFAHFIALYAKRDVSIENRVLLYDTGHEAKYYLRDFNKNCNHLTYKNNPAINCKKPIGKLTNKIGLADLIERAILKNRNYRIITDQSLNPNSIEMEEQENITLSFDGYWQDWKYVETVKQQVTSEIFEKFKMIDTDPVFNFQKKGKILVVHVRRGDYLTTNHRNKFGVIGLKSYIPEIESIRKRNPGLEVITITDEVNSLRYENNYSALGRVIGPEITNPWLLLKVMSQADYLISANSSLSWWGGYLCMTRGGKVIIPQPWFREKNQVGTGDYLHPVFSSYKSFFEA